MTDLPALEELGAGQVLLRGAALLDAARLVAAGVRAGARDGIGQPPRVTRLVEALRRQCDQLAVSGPPDVPEVAFPASSQLCTSVEAAELLSLSARQVRRLADQLGARRVSHRWLYDRDAVLAASIERRERTWHAA